MNSDKEKVDQQTTNADLEDDEPVKEERETSSGLDQNLAGLLCYLAWFVTGIIFLVIEKENRFVRFHAMQSIMTSVILFVANIVLTAIPLFGWAFGLLLTPLYLILWIFMMWKAYQGEWFKLPVVGDMAEKQVEKSMNAS